jgi:hypothetical protein
MSMIRIVFLGLAMLLPTTWTIAQAGDEAPAGEKAAKKGGKKEKKEGADKGGEKKE